MPLPPPRPRTIRRALNVLERLPPAALADLAERLIDRLDATVSDPDLEPEEDCCDAGDDGGLVYVGDRGPGDAEDAESCWVRRRRAPDRIAQQHGGSAR